MWFMKNCGNVLDEKDLVGLYIHTHSKNIFKSFLDTSIPRWIKVDESNS